MGYNKKLIMFVAVLPRIVKQLQTLASSSTAIPAPTRTSVPTPHPPTTAAEHGHAPQLQPSHTSSSLSTTAANHDDCTSTDKIKVCVNIPILTNYITFLLAYMRC